MIRNDSWLVSWAPTLALIAVPVLVAGLSVALIPSRIQLSLGSARGSSPSGFSHEPPELQDHSNAEERSAPQTTRASIVPPPSRARSRGFSPVVKEDPPRPAPSIEMSSTRPPQVEANFQIATPMGNIAVSPETAQEVEAPDAREASREEAPANPGEPQPFGVAADNPEILDAPAAEAN